MGTGACDIHDEIVPVSCCYAKKNLAKLLPALLTVLAAWQEDSDDLEDLDDWTPYKAAALCLTALSNCCPDSIDGFVLPLIIPKLQVGLLNLFIIYSTL